MIAYVTENCPFSEIVCEGPEGVVQFEGRHWNPFLACGQWQHFQLGQANCGSGSGSGIGCRGWVLTLNRIVCLVNHGSVSAAVKKGLPKDSLSTSLTTTLPKDRKQLLLFEVEPVTIWKCSAIRTSAISHNKDRNQATHGPNTAAINNNKEQKQNYEIINRAPPLFSMGVALKVNGISTENIHQREKYIVLKISRKVRLVKRVSKGWKLH